MCFIRERDMHQIFLMNIIYFNLELHILQQNKNALKKMDNKKMSTLINFISYLKDIFFF